MLQSRMPIEQKLYFSSFEDDDAFAPVVYGGKVVIFSTQYTILQKKEFLCCPFHMENWDKGGGSIIFLSLLVIIEFLAPTHDWTNAPCWEGAHKTFLTYEEKLRIPSQEGLPTD